MRWPSKSVVGLFTTTALQPRRPPHNRRIFSPSTTRHWHSPESPEDAVAGRQKAASAAACPPAAASANPVGWHICCSPEPHCAGALAAALHAMEVRRRGWDCFAADAARPSTLACRRGLGIAVAQGAPAPVPAAPGRRTPRCPWVRIRHHPNQRKRALAGPFSLIWRRGWDSNPRWT
jgi:hypothetical protein